MTDYLFLSTETLLLKEFLIFNFFLTLVQISLTNILKLSVALSS